LYQRVKRKTITWGELIDQGLANRAARKGASTEVRRKAQIECKKELKTSMDADDKIFLAMYKRCLAQGYKSTPGDLSAAERQLMQEALGITGPDDALLQEIPNDS